MIRKRVHIVIFALGAILWLPGVASADDLIHEMRVGLLQHDMDGMWSGFRRESGVDINLEAVFTPSASFMDGTVRPAIGMSVNSGGDTSKIYFDARWEYDTRSKLRPSFGLGLAIHDGETSLTRNDRKALGSSVLFHIPIEFIYRMDEHNAVSLFFDHMSNASLASSNEGMDTLGLRYGYRF